MNNIYMIKKAFLILTLFLWNSSIQAQVPNLVWADEFEGTTLNLSKWEPQIGDGCAEGICGWGNNELQHYKAENAVVSNGTLKIIAKKERVRAKNYTSARIRTKNLADFTYGRYEARIKLPAGAGLWPAFWMLSTDEPYGGWPKSGEIDIMEFVASKPETVLGYIHYGPDWPNNQHQGNYFHLYDGSKFTDNFHVFAIEWEPNIIRWYVDDILYSVKTKDDVAPYNWPFDHNFHMILNVAVGGNLGGPVDDSIFPATMEVDYVRVFDGPKPTISGNRLVANKAKGEEYRIHSIPTNVNVSWSVPQGATIVSGQGSNMVKVDFGDTSGNVVAVFNPGNGNQTLTIDVTVQPNYTRDFAFVNFDDPGNATFVSSDGTLTTVANPAPDAVNGSALSGRYVRNSQTLYDVIFYNTSAIPDASLYSSATAEKKFYMDVYTNAPVGTEILVQLETSLATSSNWPTGRHSRYVATITENGKWHRLPFNYLDKPDPAASVTTGKIAVLFNSNSYTGDVYYFDNFDSYKKGDGGSEPDPNLPPTVSITSPANGSSFAEGTSISVTASASDPDGSIAKVEFFANGNSIGVDNSSPYAVTWIVPAGTTTLTAVATDNEGATATSSPVSVTGTTSGGGDATHIYVASVITGTVNASQGNKRGTATVTVVDNLGNPSQGALVKGRFSGTFNEAAEGTTGSDGKVTLQTSGVAKGAVTVNFCIDDVSGTLPYDPSLNQEYVCSGTLSRGTGHSNAGGSVSDRPAGETAISLSVYPNPVGKEMWIQLSGFGDKITISVMDLTGKVVLQKTLTGAVNSLDVSIIPSGLYFLEANDGITSRKIRFVK
jgi:beta-glucanase (GH16 family)